jgi:hypothetical protein
VCVFAHQGNHHIVLNQDPWSGQSKKLKIWYEDAAGKKGELFLPDGEGQRLKVKRVPKKD